MSDTLADSYACCQKLARRTAKNFYYSFTGLPPDQFQAMCVLYSYMRLCDDIGDDESVPLDVRAERLSNWEAATRSALEAGRSPDHDFETGRDEFRLVFPALIDMTSRYRIPTHCFLDVINGVRMDLEAAAAEQTSSGDRTELCCQFQTFEELADYCYHVAGVVGVCCIHIWGFNDDAALKSAADCGLAFQLTNILRDLAEDADNGRVYLPAEDLARFEMTPADISGRVMDERFHQLMTFQVARAELYYAKANDLFQWLEPPGKPILKAMLKIYGGLLKEISRRHFDVYTRRVSLPTWRKLLISADAAIHRRFGRRD
ncbi:MAG: phytoene/squalene synthase family protein [Rhodopirellula sp.]|nr:phytoene/squalene synthase family protein [Rhodopirellula sp.]